MKPLPPGRLLRRLHPSDEPALLDFFRSHTKQTVFQRYHGFVPVMTHQRALQLLDVDQEHDVALAVVHPQPDFEHIDAIGRYYTEPTGQVAEMAFVVRESMRRLGLATRLLHELAVIAAAHQLRWLRAQILRDNFAMQNLLGPFTSHVHTLPYADVVEYIVPVHAVAHIRRHHAHSDIGNV